MNLLIIGNSVVDYIHTGKNFLIRPGGIYYSVTALNNFKENQDKISLLTAIDKKDYLLFRDEYEKLDEQIFNPVESIPKVHLKIEMENERHERYENINRNLYVTIKNFNLYDGILINMITGYDISVEQLKDIRKNYKGLIYFDVHTLSRGLNDRMERNFRTIPGFNEWASNLNIIQVNRNELKTLSNLENVKEIINEVLNYGIKYLILTLEDEGAKVFFKDGNSVSTIYEPAIKINVKNKVGCGDVFGAVFFYSYIKYKNINSALKFANTAAGFAASYEDLNDFKKLKNDVFTRYN